ncbi:peptide/nickel transport system ATP-binding protein [Actinobaculum suis]|uniref:Nickel import system ATP-binding protein NikD n=1 Tax=Actinobaculum suis TaxID=1657 RepID=A0A1G7ETZ7_9ACTO|nr:ATP-binding cassette domain-containing protein [Actinobaculum suis]MDY5153014.1 ATP-binding cassette domain-containing protein [Actinobaculum suis]SDE66915.1 peptide/nickel transport system ATP-binding protein [Actinobaculum suis]
MSEDLNTPLLAVRDLSISFLKEDRHGVQHEVPTISNLYAEVYAGQVSAIIGASGSGKSLLAHALLGLYPPGATVKAHIEYDGKQIGDAELRKMRGNQLALIPQSVTSLDPLMRIGNQVLGPDVSDDRRARMNELFDRYGLDAEVADMWPHELSGGMLRRVIFCAALLEDPRVIVADEPTPGMQTELAAKTLQDLRDYAQLGNGVLLITHDLELGLRVADQIGVFYGGRVVETVATDKLLAGEAKHPYTRALIAALPAHDFVAPPDVAALFNTPEVD